MTQSIARFAELARLVFTHCPAVASILMGNEYDHFRDDAYISENHYVNFKASVADAELDLVPGVRRLEKEAEALVGGAIDYTNDTDAGVQEHAYLYADRGRLYASVQTNDMSCERALVWDDLDDVRLETARSEIRSSMHLPDATSGHERMSLMDITTLAALKQNKKAWKSLEDDHYSFDDFSLDDLPEDTRVSVTVRETVAYITIFVPDGIDIFS